MLARFPLQLSRNGSGSQFLHLPCSTFLPRTITGVCISDEGRSAGEEKRQALHLDRVTLAEQQVEKEGEMYGAGLF